MKKLDLTKQCKNYYTARVTPELVEMEKGIFLSIPGKGDPSGPDFAADVGALYAAAYAIKFACKALQKDFTVAKLEGLWWFDDTKYDKQSITEAAQNIARSEWQYRLLIRMPDFVSREIITNAIRTVVSKKQLQGVNKIERHEMTEGKCVQMLHIGPFATEPVTLNQMNIFMQVKGLIKNGSHHEIYLSDFRKTKPEKLKTILREPVK